MTKQTKDSTQSPSSATRPRSQRAPRTSPLSNHGKKGRPRTQTTTDPYKVQSQFTRDFIQYLQQYFIMKLNESYIWSDNFSEKDSEEVGKLPIEDKRDEEEVRKVVRHVSRMVENDVGREFRECCVEIYRGVKEGEGVEEVKERVGEMVKKSERYSYLGLRNQKITSWKRKKSEIVRKFIELTVDLIEKIVIYK